jgi:hypothetical protein
MTRGASEALAKAQNFDYSKAIQAFHMLKSEGRLPPSFFQ